MDQIRKRLVANKFTFGLVAALLAIAVGGFFLFQNLLASKQSQVPVQEIDLAFETDGPYALLLPRRDGNALDLKIKRVSSYDEIKYELAYQSQTTPTGEISEDQEVGGGIDRGVQGTLDTKSKKNEYSQEILFGTCSKGDTMSLLHCVFDKGVENGTLVLRIKQGNVVHKMTTTWHLQRPDVALGVITSGDNHFIYTTKADKQALSTTGYTIVNDLTGVPKLPEGKQVSGKVYALNVPTARVMPAGEVTIELAQNPPSEAKIARYNEGQNAWEVMDTKINGSKLTANATAEGIFAVLIDVPKQ